MSGDRFAGHRHGHGAGNASCNHLWGTQSENAAGPIYAVCLKCGFIPSSAPEERVLAAEAIKHFRRTIIQNCRNWHRMTQMFSVRAELAEYKRRERQAARLRGRL